MFDKLRRASQAGTAWADRTRRALVKRNSGQPLGRGLAAATSALDRARAQLSRLQVPTWICPLPAHQVLGR